MGLPRKRRGLADTARHALRYPERARWYLHRLRRDVKLRVSHRDHLDYYGAVVDDLSVSAGELRARAERALSEGRHEDAVVDGFRALTVRQAERGYVEDLPGATAHEVAVAVGAAHPAHRGRVTGSAAVFDQVRYGDHPATATQVVAVLELDDDLRGRP